MSKKIASAVMNCTKDQPQSIIDSAIKVKNGLYDNIGLFVMPTVDEIEFETQLEEASTAQGEVKGGGKSATISRDTKCYALFNSLGKLILYVNGLYKGDKEKLAASGFPLSSDPTPHSIPTAPVIKLVANGKTPHSARILLAKITSPLNTKKDNYTYAVQMAVTNNELMVFNTVLQTKNQFKLNILDLTRGQEVTFRIARSNSKGQSDWSNPYSFIPQ